VHEDVGMIQFVESVREDKHFVQKDERSVIDIMIGISGMNQSMESMHKGE